MVSTQEVIDKYFNGDRTLYFQQSDALRSIEGETFLRYQKDGGIQLFMCGDNGEVCILHTRDGEILEKMIKLIVYLR